MKQSVNKNKNKIDKSRKNKVWFLPLLIIIGFFVLLRFGVVGLLIFSVAAAIFVNNSHKKSKSPILQLNSGWAVIAWAIAILVFIAFLLKLWMSTWHFPA